MSGVIFNFFIRGPKRVEFPIGIIDYGSQCNMLYWMYYRVSQTISMNVQTGKLMLATSFSG